MDIASDLPGVAAHSPTVRLARAGWYHHDSAAKRLLDLTVALTAILLTLPLWPLIAIAIRLDSPGPVFFGQDRVGRDGRRFRFYKFRSMHRDAEARLAEVLQVNEMSGPVFKIRRDPRITRVGAFLRKTSLDELPQLYNVLRGDMSAVGPRPPLPHEVQRYRPSDAVRLSVKPGLTCFWQVSGRSNCDFDRWMELDRRYVETMNFRVELEILWRTAWVVISCVGAY